MPRKGRSNLHNRNTKKARNDKVRLERENEEETQSRLNECRDRQSHSRSQESPEAHSSRVSNVNLANKRKRTSDSPKKIQQNISDAAHKVHKRANETEEERRQRLNSEALRKARRLSHLRNAVTNDINETLPQYQQHYIGSLDSICNFCNAMHFEVERPTDKLFTSCCRKGKLKLPELTPLPDILHQLFTKQHEHSTVFLDHIRSYNSALSFASFGHTPAEIPGRGPYVFKIHGAIYHKTSQSLRHPGNKTPKFAQLYIYDTAEALNYRQTNPQNDKMNFQLLHDLDVLIRQINPFANAYQMLKNLYDNEVRKAEQENRAVIPICMSICRNKTNDPRRYNNPNCNEVAVIFESQEGIPPFDRDILVHFLDESPPKHISILDANLDPMTYPLLFPYGDAGWSALLKLEGAKIRDGVTMLHYFSYRLQIRGTFNPLLSAGRLTQQYIVDSYVKHEANQLNWLKKHQEDLRVEHYQGLLDFVSNHSKEQGSKAGVPIILPSSFQGSPRAMQQNFQDAMAIVSAHGKPDIFLTITCNPDWKEIKENLNHYDTVANRPDLVARVFQQKKKALLHDIDQGVLGVAVGKIFVIEFQKRGLPHMHLLVILREEDKPRTKEIIDKLVSAEIPDASTNPRLRSLVLKHMVHGPCGTQNKNSPCMKEGKCSKKYPKNFEPETKEKVNGYPVYRRRESNVPPLQDQNKKSGIIDNRWIVPYSPYFLLKYECHINVEICASIKAIKYLFKYIYKGYDCANVKFEVIDGESILNEITTYVDSRYVSPPEAMWRLNEFRMHEHSHTVIRLAVHLQYDKNVCHRVGEEEQAVQAAGNKNSMLEAWFARNMTDTFAATLKYLEMPLHYIFDKNEWRPRKKEMKIIPRLATASPREGERFYLRLILLHAKGATSFQDLKTPDGQTQPCGTFQEPARLLGLLQDDDEWKKCLREAGTIRMPAQQRELFAYICLYCEPSNPLELWEMFQEDLIQDFMHRSNDNKEESINRGLSHIQEVLRQQGKNCGDYQLPQPPDNVANTYDFINYEYEREEACRLQNMLTAEQQAVFDAVVAAVEDDNVPSRLFYLDGMGGSGKTFLYNTLIHHFRSKKVKVAAVASTGIAANLLPGGRTHFSQFGLPVPLLDTSVSRIRGTTQAGRDLKETKLIIWDEVTMASSLSLNAVNNAMKDLKDTDKPFGGAVVLLGGDFRQILPVVKHGNRVTIIESTIKFSRLWCQFESFKLTKNKRSETDPQFCKWLLGLGNGDLENYPADTDSIQIPDSMLELDSIVETIYGKQIRLEELQNYVDRAILCPKNEDVEKINEEVQKLLDGEAKIYRSIDSHVKDDDSDAAQIPIEVLNKLCPSGVPLHELSLKVGSIVILQRNLNTKKNLCNGTRLIVKNMQQHVIHAEIISGNGKGQNVFLPRIDLIPTDVDLPFQLKRRQFPLKLAWAMTINKSQGQTLEKVGLYLPSPVFCHGQLYVACSRVQKSEDLHIKIIPAEGQGKDKSNKWYTTNCIYKEIFD